MPLISRHFWPGHLAVIVIISSTVYSSDQIAQILKISNWEQYFENHNGSIWADTEVSPKGFIFYRILKQTVKISCCWQISAIFPCSQRLFTFCFLFLICQRHKASLFWNYFCTWYFRIEKYRKTVITANYGYSFHTS